MRESGKCKFWNQDKSFGFIQRDHGTDVFVHVSTLKEAGLDRLQEGQPVSFEAIPGKDGKGPKASKIALA